MLALRYQAITKSIYLCVFVRRFTPLQSAGQPPDAGEAHNGQTTGVSNIFPSALCGCEIICFPHYNLSPAMKIYRRHQRMPTCFPWSRPWPWLLTLRFRPCARAAGLANILEYDMQ